MNEFCIIHNDPITGDRWLTWPGDPFPGETREQHIARVVTRSIPNDGRTYRVFAQSQMPSHNGLDPRKQFVDAWKVQDDSVVVDQAMARRCWLNRLRDRRDAVIEHLNKQIQVARDTGNTGRELALIEKKNRITQINMANIQNRINAANTLDELRAITHPDLGD